MKLLTIFIFLATTILSTLACSIKGNNKKDHQILFCYRNGGGIDDYLTFQDILTITNYENNTLTAKELYEIAKRYVDTVKAREPVSGVYFSGKDQKRPRAGSWDSEKLSAQERYFIIYFGFSNNFKINFNKPITLSNIEIWRKGSFTSYYLHSKGVIDSIINSPVPLNNE